MIEITKFKVDGKIYDELPRYLEKDGQMRPVTYEFFIIEEIKEQFDDAPMLEAIAKKKAYIESIKNIPTDGQ